MQGSSIRTNSSTFCGSTRSQKPPPAWDRVAHPPDTSRRKQPGRRNAKGRQRWDRQSERNRRQNPKGDKRGEAAKLPPGIRVARNHNHDYRYQIQDQLTWYSVLSIPMRKSSSATNRLMHRFLWIVLRSVCRPRRKQKVEMQMARHTKEMTMPTQVITNRINSCIRPWYWGPGGVRPKRKLRNREENKRGQRNGDTQQGQINGERKI